MQYVVDVNTYIIVINFFIIIIIITFFYQMKYQEYNIVFFTVMALLNRTTKLSNNTSMF